MTQYPYFPKEIYDSRLRKFRDTLIERDLDGCLVSVPEHIYYLAGVNHWGFFAHHMLIVPTEGEMIMVARAMEQMTMDVQLTNARFIGYGDLDDPSIYTVKVLEEKGLEKKRLGIEKDSLFLQLEIAERIIKATPGVDWVDASDILKRQKMTLSPPEVAYTKRAAAVSDVMMQTAIQTATAGVSEKEVAAEVYKVMVLAGGEYPAFGPFIRSTPSLGFEHGTWSDRILENGDLLFVELSGSVARYHAPMGRLIFVGDAPESSKKMEKICLDSFQAVVDAIRPSVTANSVYQTWQDLVDEAGLPHYRRHHCGYMVGSAFPPAWSGGGVPKGLRRNSPMELKEGMVFHLMSWLMHTGQGDYFVSDSALVTKNGCEVLTKEPQTIHVV